MFLRLEGKEDGVKFSVSDLIAEEIIKAFNNSRGLAVSFDIYDQDS